jgi:hypothetical protein
MMLCGVSVRFNRFRDDVLGIMCCKRRPENRQLLELSGNQPIGVSLNRACQRPVTE